MTRERLVQTIFRADRMKGEMGLHVRMCRPHLFLFAGWKRRVDVLKLKNARENFLPPTVLGGCL